jgi:hypothetical protein
MVMRQVVLRMAFQSIRHDFEAYEATWRELHLDVEENSVIQAMLELTTRMTNLVTEARPYQALHRLAPPPAAAGNTDQSTHGGSVLDGGAAEGHLAFLPREMSVTHSQGCADFLCVGVCCRDLQQNGSKLISLDTLYTQACNIDVTKLNSLLSLN